MSAPEGADGIAIIGMACRFPGAENPTAFWRNLCQGVESVTFFSDAELLDAGVDPALLQSPDYVKAAPILSGIDTFDAAFFEYSPKEAAVMDPQHRLFLEIAWEALEDAGYAPQHEAGLTGVFAGAGGVVTSYLVAHPHHPELAGQTGGLSHIGNDKDFLSTRVSYKLNLTGPSLTVQTACSTSLVAVHLACQSLLSGECDTALAGASTVRLPHIRGYQVEKGNIHSPDGHCRAFDAAAQGTVFGSGAGAVVLKKVSDALDAGDHIYAVIKSTAVNNDGGQKVSYTSSSVAGQSRAMVEALALAEVNPETLRYVECHGTGTIVGDPLELQALSRAFRLHTSSRAYCAIGSVKTNIGHLEQTAGMASLMKVALALKHGAMPPSLNFTTPNPKIDFAQSPFYVNTALQAWPADATPRRAAVNALGLGGTNAFAILEGAPAPLPSASGPERSTHLFSLSTKSEAALTAAADRMRAFLHTQPDISLADVCYTANVSRTSLPYRLSVVTEGVDDLARQLETFVTSGDREATLTSQRPQKKPLVMLFTGQGSQYQGMAAQLYHTQPIFRETLEQCDAQLRSVLDKPLLEVLFASQDSASLLHETAYTQVALFAMEYALFQVWNAWGVTPDAVMGHSLGELVAACVAGVMDLNDGLALVAQRGALMQGLPKQGAMAVALAPEDIVQEVLEPYADLVSIAAVNSPRNTVISGEQRAVGRVVEALHHREIMSKTLTVSHAFHSPLMEPILDAFEQQAQRITYKDPRIPLVSNVTGKPMDEGPQASYWRDHIRRAVRFADSIITLHELGYEHFLEVGPGTTLLGMGRQCLPSTSSLWLSSLRKDQEDWRSLLESVRQLYLRGYPIAWAELDLGYPRRRMSLPTYPFQRKRYWLADEAHVAPRSSHSTAADLRSHPLLGDRLRSGLKEVQFESRYGLDFLPYLGDHRIYDMVVLPTTAGLEAVIAAGRTWWKTREVALENLIYHEAMVMSDDEHRLVHLILTPQGADQAVFELLSTDLDAASNWRRHMTGTMRRSRPSAPVFDVEPGAMRWHRAIPASRYYATVRPIGLGYGPIFQGIQELWQGDGEALSVVRLPEHVAHDAYGLHPAFLDACLHIYPVLAAEYGDFSTPLDPPDITYLPISVGRFYSFQEQVTEAWVHAVRREHVTTTGTLVLDLRIYDRESNPVAVIEGLSVRRLAPEILCPSTAAASIADWLYQIRWDELPPAAATPDEAASSWLIFADHNGLGEALAEWARQRGDHCHLVIADRAFARQESTRWLVNPACQGDFARLLQEMLADESLPCQRVVYLWGCDLPAMQDMTVERLEAADALATQGALGLIQALAEARDPGRFTPRLWLVTRNTQAAGSDAMPVDVAAAPLWGLGRVVPLEYPQMWGGLIDLPSFAPTDSPWLPEALVTEILQTDREDQVALRQHGKRFGARLVRLTQTPPIPARPEAESKGTYLITGGLGMLVLRLRGDWCKSMGYAIWC